MMGKLYSNLDVKWTFLVNLFIFELGSLICGLAPNSVALIVGVCCRAPNLMELHD
jgi:MFS transporter, DHA2 family, glioxin efflux transporter